MKHHAASHRSRSRPASSRPVPRGTAVPAPSRVPQTASSRGASRDDARDARGTGRDVRSRRLERCVVAREARVGEGGVDDDENGRGVEWWLLANASRWRAKGREGARERGGRGHERGVDAVGVGDGEWEGRGARAEKTRTKTRDEGARTTRGSRTSREARSMGCEECDRGDGDRELRDGGLGLFSLYQCG
jgi:hypothetical protein